MASRSPRSLSPPHAKGRRGAAGTLHESPGGSVPRLTLGREAVVAVATALSDGPVHTAAHPLGAATVRRVLADGRGLGLRPGHPEHARRALGAVSPGRSDAHQMT